MNTIQINPVLCAGFVLMMSFGTIHSATAQQGKPAAKAVASTQKPAVSPAKCSGKNMSCCKGTPSRSSVLASVAAKAKPVNSK